MCGVEEKWTDEKLNTWNQARQRKGRKEETKLEHGRRNLEKKWYKSSCSIITMGNDTEAAASCDRNDDLPKRDDGMNHTKLAQR